jgi:hypothetical protein
MLHRITSYYIILHHITLYYIVLLCDRVTEKNTPQPNLSHLQLANEIPQLEGEGSPSPPLYRTGSDSDLPATTQNRYYEVDMLNGVEVGPNLRMAKSSSLESLQTILHYTINADVGKNAR